MYTMYSWNISTNAKPQNITVLQLPTGNIYEFLWIHRMFSLL